MAEICGFGLEFHPPANRKLLEQMIGMSFTDGDVELIEWLFVEGTERKLDQPEREEIGAQFDEFAARHRVSFKREGFMPFGTAVEKACLAFYVPELADDLSFYEAYAQIMNVPPKSGVVFSSDEGRLPVLVSILYPPNSLHRPWKAHAAILGIDIARLEARRQQTKSFTRVCFPAQNTELHRALVYFNE